MKIKIRIPATSANLGPGFDILGAAFKLYNNVEVEYLKKANSGRVEIIGEGKDSLPHDETNIVWQAMKSVLKAYLPNWEKKYSFDRFHIKLINRIPLASGLGSSAAARLGGILAANELLKKKLDCRELLMIGVKLEGHPDNIVPAMIGGLCVSTVLDKEVKFIKLPFPKLKAVVCNPDFELVTDKTRKVLPQQVSLAVATFNSSRLAMLLSAFQTGQYDFIKIAMEDMLHQPHREHLVPGMYGIFRSAIKNGAYGAALSGAGPSIIAFSKIGNAVKVGRAMQKTWSSNKISSKVFILDFDPNGARVTR